MTFRMSLLPSFDPQQVPVERIDHDLPAVEAARLTPDALRARFAHPPVWQPEVVRERKFMDRSPADAAVLLAIVMHDEPTVLLTQRTAHLSTHSGQIAFAGGKCDPHDRDASATALREAHEEVGLEPRHVEVIGHLPQYVTGSAFYVTPVVGLVSTRMQLSPNPHEVACAFEVPLSFLMNPAHHRWHVYEFQGVQRRWLSMPYEIDGHVHFIWGATAGMLRNFYRFLAA